MSDKENWGLRVSEAVESKDAQSTGFATEVAPYALLMDEALVKLVTALGIPENFVKVHDRNRILKLLDGMFAANQENV